MGYPKPPKFLTIELPILPRPLAKRIASFVASGKGDVAISQLDHDGCRFRPEERRVLQLLMHTYAAASSKERWFEILTTDQYSDVQEWSVTARTTIKPGLIPCLEGVLHRVTEEQLKYPPSLLCSVEVRQKHM